MLVGEPPYPGTTAQAVLGKIIAGKPVSAAEHRSSVPANVDAAVRCALEKLPADRFGSVQEFVRALEDEHFRYGELVAAGASAAVGPWNRPTIMGWSAAAVLALVLSWSLLRPEPPQPVSRQVLSTEGWAGLEGPRKQPKWPVHLESIASSIPENPAFGPFAARSDRRAPEPLRGPGSAPIRLIRRARGFRL